MKALIGILMFIFIWVPVLVAGAVAPDPAAKQPARRRRMLTAAALALLGQMVLLYAFLNGVSPFRALFGAFRGQTGSLTAARWCIAVLFGLPLGAVTGCAVRYAGSGRHRSRRVWVPLERRKKAWLILLSACAAMPLILGAYLGLNGTAQLRLQEICREQDVLSADAEDADVGYVILKNNGILPCETEGMQLVSDTGDRACALTSKTIAPGETMLFQTGKDRFVDIKKSGGSTVSMVTASGAEVDTVTLPEMPDNTACRLTETGWETCLLDTAAEIIETAKIRPPAFSAESGFYENAFSLSLSAPEGCEIYYTLDGSIPSAESERYTAPIRVYDRSAEPNRFRSIQNVRRDYLSHHEIGTEPVDKAFVVRAIALDGSGAPSPVVTATYFVGADAYRDRTVVSLVADPDALFGEDGIYVTGARYEAWYQAKREAEAAGETYSAAEPPVNFMQHGSEWERPASFELFQDGASVLNQPVGIRVQGNTSRNYALKRFSVFSRSQYSGSRLFAAPLFGDKQTHSVTLRAGFENAFCNEIAKDRDLAVLRAEPVTVFLNGEFWYDTYLQEKYSNTFFSETYGVAKDDVEYLRIGLWRNATAADKDAYSAFLNQFQNADLSDAQAYAAFCESVDVQSYIDYACVNAYLANCDSDDKLNTCVWRTKTNEFTAFGDRRWRWALQDMDLMRDEGRDFNGYRTAAEIDSFRDTFEETRPPLLSGGTIWESLKASPIFCRQFVLTFMDLVNTIFAPDHVEQLLQTWGRDLSYDDGFFRDRAGYITRYMERELGLSGTQETLTITADEPDGGVITLNTITPDLSDGSWSGMYYTDYPVTLTAAPAEGRRFVCWEINGERFTDLTIEVPIRRGGSSVHAIFQ